MSLGYACQNITLSKLKNRVITNRGMVKKTFLTRGLEYAGELAKKNVEDLLTIIEWNIQNNIKLFRISSDIFPWVSHYKINMLPQYDELKILFKTIGKLIQVNQIRVTFHPGPFNVLPSPNENVIQNTIKDLTIHSEIFNLIGVSDSVYNKINIHCNGVYGDKKSAMDRFCSNFNRLPDGVKNRLTIENDDKETMYSVKDLMYIHEKIGIPIVFDYHHHKFCTGGLNEKEALLLALSTWPKNIKPVVHYSESKSEHEKSPNIKKQAHSDFIKKLPNLYGNDVDVMVEAKSKELSILPFL